MSMELRKQVHIIAALVSLVFTTGSAQDADTMRVAVRRDSVVFVYHTAHLPPAHGFNIYRRDSPQGEERKLNDDPVKGAAFGGEFRTIMGERFQELQGAFKQSNASEILIALRSSPIDARLYTFAYPEAARALGRVFVDRSAPIGRRVTYRIAVTDPFGTETGRSLQTTVNLDPESPQAPSAISVSNRDDLVTLSWRYSVPGAGRDDKVVRFDVLRILPGPGGEERLNRTMVLRNEASDLQSFLFRVQATGVEERIVVRAIDISGQTGPSSPVLSFSVRDTVPPSVPFEVEVTLLPDATTEITWPVTVESDGVGYHVYRAASVSGDAPLQRLTHEPLPLLQTVYRDTTIPAGRGTWFYRVSTLDRSGNESKPSNAAMAMIEDKTPPGTPHSVSAEYLQDKSVRLRWQSPPLPRDFQTFIIMRRKFDRGAPELPARINVENVTALQFIDPGEPDAGFQEGTTYRYFISSADSTRNISDSAFVDIAVPRTTAPGPPSGVGIRNENGIRAVVIWSSPSVPGIARYTINRQEPGRRDTVRFIVDGTKREYRDETVHKGARYVYWVTQSDSAGNESTPSAADTVVIRGFNPPRAVRNIRADVVDRGVLVRWEPVPDSIVGYRVFRSTIATGVFEPVTPEFVNGTDWLDQNGKEGTWYRVQAYDPSGNVSAPGSPAQAMDFRRRDR